MAITRPVAFTLLLAAATAFPQDDKAPAFPSSVELVTVDVVARDPRGEPVGDLRVGDFTVLENGRRQAITSFVHVAGDGAVTGMTLNHGGGAAPSDTSPPQALPSPGRNLVVVFDQVHLTTLEAHRARRALTAFLTREVRKDERVRLVAVDGWEFEGSRDEALDKVSQLEGRRVPDQGPEALTDFEAMRIDQFDDGPLMLRVMERIAILTTGGRPRDAEGERIRNTTPAARGMRINEGHIRLLAKQAYRDAVTRNETTLATLEAVLRGLSAARGRKAVVLCSSALIKDPDLDGYDRVVEAAARANAVLYFVDARALEGIPGESAEFGTYLPSIDQGIALAHRALEIAGAESLASDTGGFTVKNRNDLAGGFRRIAGESRDYYLLGYSPPSGRPDGKLRKIRVKVSRKDVTVRARSGYYRRPPAVEGVTR